MEEVFDLQAWMQRINEYEDAHENAKISLSQEEILKRLQDKIKSLSEKAGDDTIEPVFRKFLFYKRCVLRQVLDDLLEIPEETRPWTSNERKWLEEMKEREN